MKISLVPEARRSDTQLVKFQRNKKKVGLVASPMNTAIFRGWSLVEDILEEIIGDFTTSMSPTLAEGGDPA